MLCSSYSTNEAFDEIPCTTNAVESHNRAFKTTTPSILKVALMETYNIDIGYAKAPSQTGRHPNFI